MAAGAKILDVRPKRAASEPNSDLKPLINPQREGELLPNSLYGQPTGAASYVFRNRIGKVLGPGYCTLQWRFRYIF